MNYNLNLDELQLDTLKEICSMGAGYAITAISRMVKRKISMSVPHISIVPTEKLITTISTPQELVVGVYSKILGELSGGMLITFPRNSAFSLVDILLNRTVGETKILEELEKSVLQETGNIVINSFVNVLSKMVDRKLFVSVPKIAFDMAGAIIDFLLIELSKNVEQTIVMEIIFHDIPETISGKFFILPDYGLLEILLSAIAKKSNS
ncbi:MAG: chemotaxis protein CheC [Candidatus Aenigmatarchaeota archaeon]